MELKKSELISLYHSGKSMAEIASTYRVSVHKISYWMNKYNIPKRSISDAIYLKHNGGKNPFNLSKSYDPELFALGIGLFLGEGTKKQKFSVRLANSDPKLIRLFLRFLTEICGVKKVKIKAWINLYDDKIYNKAHLYWSKETGIAKSNFYSPVIRAHKNGTYKNRSEYGTITVLVSNTKLLKQIFAWCELFTSKYA